MTTFLTGSTGFLGSYLALALLEQGESLILHVRAKDAISGRYRVRRALEKLTDLGRIPDLDRRIDIVTGDLAANRLGINQADEEKIIAQCNYFLHCGASVRFDLSLTQSRAINVNGTNGVLALAWQRQKKAKLNRVDIVSTAYVAGTLSGQAFETEPDARSSFKNTYEQSKYEAELMAWEAMSDLPICIHRPSIIIGEQVSGKTTNFNTLYAPIRIYALGLWRTLPAKRDTVLDLVPVDFVRDAIIELRKHPQTLSRCFHITAGDRASIRIDQVVRIVENLFPEGKKVRYQDGEMWQRFVMPVLGLIPSDRVRQVIPVLRSYLPYMIENPTFDTTDANAFLSKAGITPPDAKDFINTILNYAIESDFGRKAAACPAEKMVETNLC